MFRFRRKRKSSDPVAVVQRFVDAANRHDSHGIADCLHPDFDSMQPIYPSRNFRGSDQVRRNWQAIFQSEPGFRLTLLRSAATEGTVWIELHGAGQEVEVAGVFIMGVENNLVRWARVYSAVVDQEFQGPVDTGEAQAQAEDDGVTDARVAAELREMIDAGRHLTVVGEPEAAAESSPAADDDTGLWAAPADEGEEAAMPSELATGEVPVVSAFDGEPAAGPGAGPVVVADEPAQEAELEPGPEAVVADGPDPEEPQPQAEPEPVVAGPEAEAEPVVAGPAVAAVAAEVGPAVAAVAAEPEPVETEPDVARTEAEAEGEPVVAAEPEPVETEPDVAGPRAEPEPEPVVADPAPPAEPVAAADEPAAAADEPAAAAWSPDEAFEPSPRARRAEPVIDLVIPSPAASTTTDDGQPAAPTPVPTAAEAEDEEHAVLELKPERRFRRMPRPSGRRP